MYFVTPFPSFHAVKSGKSCSYAQKEIFCFAFVLTTMSLIFRKNTQAIIELYKANE